MSECKIVGTFPHDPYPSCEVHLGEVWPCAAERERMQRDEAESFAKRVFNADDRIEEIKSDYFGKFDHPSRDTVLWLIEQIEQLKSKEGIAKRLRQVEENRKEIIKDRDQQEQGRLNAEYEALGQRAQVTKWRGLTARALYDLRVLGMDLKLFPGAMAPEVQQAINEYELSTDSYT